MTYVRLRRPVELLMTYNLGVVVVGDTRVGKTALITTYGSGEIPAVYETTVGHTYITSLSINGEEIEVNVHDTGGSTAHVAVRQQLYNKADVFLICFSLCDRKTFQHVEQFWLNELRRLRGNAPFIIVGCKADMRDTHNSLHVQTNEVLKLAMELNCHYYECSATTQRNIKEAFDKAIKIAMELEPHAMPNKQRCFWIC